MAKDTVEDFGPDFHEWVAASHDGIEAHAVFTKEAFDQVHKENGWSVVKSLGFSRTSPGYIQEETNNKSKSEPAKAAQGGSQ